MVGSSKKQTTTIKISYQKLLTKTVMQIGKVKRLKEHGKSNLRARIEDPTRNRLILMRKWRIGLRGVKEVEGPREVADEAVAVAEVLAKDNQEVMMSESENILEIIINLSIDIFSSGFYASQYLRRTKYFPIYFSDEGKVFNPIDHLGSLAIVLINQLDVLVDFELNSIDHLLLHISKHLRRHWHLFPLQQLPIKLLEKLMVLYFIYILHSQTPTYVSLQ